MALFPRQGTIGRAWTVLERGLSRSVGNSPTSEEPGLTVGGECVGPWATASPGDSNPSGPADYGVSPGSSWDGCGCDSYCPKHSPSAWEMRRTPRSISGSARHPKPSTNPGGDLGPKL